MKSPASPSRRPKASLIAAFAIATVGITLGAGLAPAQSPAEDPSRVPEPFVRPTAAPFADRFPNVVLKTHEGRNVRFYDDLLKDKIVMINFMYATCKER